MAMTIKEAAERSRYSRATIMRYINKNVIPSFKEKVEGYNKKKTFIPGQKIIFESESGSHIDNVYLIYKNKKVKLEENITMDEIKQSIKTQKKEIMRDECKSCIYKHKQIKYCPFTGCIKEE